MAEEIPKVRVRVNEQGREVTDNFFGGVGTSDGDGHGHVVVDNETGKVVYARESKTYLPDTDRDDRVSVNDRSSPDDTAFGESGGSTGDDDDDD